MLKKYPAVSAIVVLLFLAACQQPAPAGGIWFYTHSSGNKDIADSSLNPASFIQLNENGSYTSDWGHFEYGTWIYSNQQIFLSSQQKGKSVIEVNYLTAKEMQVGPPKGPFDNFERQPAAFAPANDNPFSKENNLWRIKAAAKETDIQLKQRLVNHCRFWEMYFTWALNNHIDYIDVRSTPTPIKIYGNGFGLKPPEQLPALWKAYFYDEEDCLAAGKKIKRVFDNSAIAWPHTGNKYKMFISAFQQMQQKLQ